MRQVLLHSLGYPLTHYLDYAGPRTHRHPPASALLGIKVHVLSCLERTHYLYGKWSHTACQRKGPDNGQNHFLFPRALSKHRGVTLHGWSGQYARELTSLEDTFSQWTQLMSRVLVMGTQPGGEKWYRPLPCLPGVCACGCVYMCVCICLHVCVDACVCVCTCV